MKIFASVLFLLCVSSSVDANIHTKGSDHDYQEDRMERMLQRGKKGMINGGKKGGMNSGNDEECTDNAFEILNCLTDITQSGRNVLNRDLNCGFGEYGVTILVDDVHLDCRGHQIHGIGKLSPYGIGVFSVKHVNLVPTELEFSLSSTLPFPTAMPVILILA
jgi:hypothetical protein